MLATALRRLHSILRITLELFGMANRGGAKSINAPFQVLYLHLLGLAEIARVLSMECVLQCLTHIETVFRQSDGIFVANHRVLVGGSIRVQRFTGGRRTRLLTRTRARIALTVSKTPFPRGTSTTCVFKMAMQKLRSDTTISLAPIVIVMIISLV